MNRNLLLLLFFLPGFVFTHNIKAHPGVDPILVEINDYMMAIQILKTEDVKAQKIFMNWQELRKASWRIRELTDDQDLLIHAEEVMRQISTTKAKRIQLLQDCREYFNSIINIEPNIQIVIDSEIQIRWENPLLQTPIQHRRILPIEILNNRKESTTMLIRAQPHDEILFWNKKITLESESQRFAFVVLAPIHQKKSMNSLTFTDQSGKRVEVPVRLHGLPSEGSKSNSPESFFEESIKFQITDRATRQPIAARIEVRDVKENSYWAPLKGPAYGVGHRTGWGAPARFLP